MDDMGMPSSIIVYKFTTMSSWGDHTMHTNQYSESHPGDTNFLPSPKKSKVDETSNGNGNVNISIISLINHYTAFSETIKGNSATTTQRYIPVHTPTNPSHEISIPLTAPLPKAESKKQDFLIAVIPAYNEEIAIGSVVIHTRQYVDSVIVVDDGSSDKTALIARAAGAEVITLPENKGKANAMMKGFSRARELNPAAVIMLDADGQHDPAEIPTLVKPVLEGKADLVIGSRFLISGNNIPSYRQLGQKTLNIATHAGSGYASTDSQSGFRAISRKGLDYLNFTSEGYNIESDMITHFIEKELVITEEPITVKYDVPNKHKKNPVEHGVDILGHLIGLIGYKRPLLTFGVPGLILIGGGLFFGSWAFADYYATTKFPFSLSMLSTLLLIMGMLLVTSGFILNSLVQIVRLEKGAD